MDGPRFIEVNGVRIAVWEQAGPEPALLLCHATGFHARCWDAITDRLPGRRCVAIDMRGHGRSGKVAPPVRWRDFGRDVAEVCRKLELRSAMGVGHSMGGHSIALAAALAQDAFSRLMLIDPVVLAASAYGTPMEQEHFARKRRNRWTSAAEMYARFRDRSPFDRWDARVLRDYCDYALEPAPDGDGCVLACAPEVEASVYEQSHAAETNIRDEIARVEIPVLVMRSERPLVKHAALDMLASPTDPQLAGLFPNGRDKVVAYSHFVPMEAPEHVATEIAMWL